MRAKTSKVPISERALLQRLNRKFKDDDLIVKKTRPNSRSASDLGDYYILNFNRNFIVDKQLNLADVEEMGRKHKALAKWEEVS
jgi:hypothetical protein